MAITDLDTLVLSTDTELDEYFNWLYEVAGAYPTRSAMADALIAARSHRDEVCADEARAEAHAEGAWLRAAEAGTPDSWAEEDRERAISALGYGPPPGI